MARRASRSGASRHWRQLEFLDGAAEQPVDDPRRGASVAIDSEGNRAAAGRSSRASAAADDPVRIGAGENRAFAEAFRAVAGSRRDHRLCPERRRFLLDTAANR